MTTLARFIAKTAGWFSQRLGRGGGTTLPGVVLLKLRPRAIRDFSADLRHGTVLCSATNGKTTTTHLINAATEAAGYRTVTNNEGSNLARGVAAAFLKASAEADLGVFEVDEAALAAVARDASPSVIVLMNLFRDQLDRYGELETLVDRWSEVLDDVGAQHEPPLLVLNADDPNIAALGHGRDDVIWFGVDDQSHSVDGLDHASDATHCRACGTALTHSVVLLGHLGHWDCPVCERTRPTPAVAATSVALTDDGLTATISYPSEDGTPIDVDVDSALAGIHNAYNITAAFAAAYAVAIRNKRPLEPYAAARAIGQTQPAFGRGETVDVDDKQLRMLLAKNPTGVNQNIRTIMNRDEPLHVLVLLNDRTADGQDVSWIWDVDWEPLQPHLASLTLGGDRAWDLALRFRYGGFDMDAIKVAPNVDKALDVALAAVSSGGTLHALPTYTAMLDLRYLLTQRGYTSPYWSEQ